MASPDGLEVDMPPEITTQEFFSIVPTFNPEMLQLTKIPSPPLIPLVGGSNGKVSNKEACHCAMWLRAWIRKNYGSTAQVERSLGGRRRWDKSRDWKALQDGIRILVKNRFSAARWVSFVVTLPVVTESSRAPSYRTVFSRGIVHNQMDFAKDTTPELGGRLLFTERAKALARDHSMMMQDLKLQGATSTQAVRKIVREYFPGESFKRRVAAVRADSACSRERYEREVAAKEWIW